MIELKELELQKAVYQILSDPAIIRKTESGKRLQILSPGKHNDSAGPDYLEIAILLDGMVVVGDAEFHKNASDWFKHKHNNDERYNSVILHLILNNDKNIDVPFETFLINRVELQTELSQKRLKKKIDILSIQDLQDYSLKRLLSKTSDAKKVLDFSKLRDTIIILTSRFLDKYNRGKKRPVYTIDEIKSIPETLADSDFYNFLNMILTNENMFIIDIINKLLTKRFASEGKNLRSEIFLNCILPIALCLANEKARIDLFLWYWSTPSLNKYGVLTKRFPNIPQNYIWQQQGMLQYMKEHGNRKNIVSDIIKDYGFAETLSFYRVGRLPID